MHIQISKVINRPVEEVFEFMSDPEKEKLYRIGLIESEQLSEGPFGVGTTTREVSQFFGRRIETVSEVTEYEPNKKVSMKTISGPMQAEFSIILNEVNGGTEVTYEVEGETGGFFKLADPIVARMGKRQMESELANLKDLLEAQG